MLFAPDIHILQRDTDNIKKDTRQNLCFRNVVFATNPKGILDSQKEQCRSSENHLQTEKLAQGNQTTSIAHPWSCHTERELKALSFSGKIDGKKARGKQRTLFLQQFPGRPNDIIHAARDREKWKLFRNSTSVNRRRRRRILSIIEVGISLLIILKVSLHIFINFVGIIFSIFWFMRSSFAGNI